MSTQIQRPGLAPVNQTKEEYAFIIKGPDIVAIRTEGATLSTLKELHADKHLVALPEEKVNQDYLDIDLSQSVIDEEILFQLDNLSGEGFKGKMLRLRSMPRRLSRPLKALLMKGVSLIEV